MKNFKIVVTKTITGVLFYEAESEHEARSAAEGMGKDGAVAWDEYTPVLDIVDIEETDE